MTNQKLNNYVLHYLEKDQTRCAIMLSAPWGTGKSYYIQNILIPFICERKDYKVIVVSAYGLSNINDISKSIYFESKFKILNPKNEAMQTAKFVGKTILKGVTSFFGIDLSTNEKALSELYKTIDLNKKLIVIEDIERTSINILELLGFVNNLVEHDNAKVLLVANEDELIKYEEIIDENNKKLKVLTHEAKEYLRVKEKTISDTLHYWPDFISTYETILEQYRFNELTGIPNKEISLLVHNCLIKENQIGSRVNLRSIIFGIQKTVDILKFMNNYGNADFVKTLLIGNIIFALKKKNNESIIWDKDNQGAQLGTAEYPLFKFAYDYIINQVQDSDEANKTFLDFCKHIDFANKQSEKSSKLKPFFSFYIESEAAVKESINFLCENISNNEIIPTREYGRIANYLIAIRRVIGNEEIINKCLDRMLDIVDSESIDIIESLEFYSGIELIEQEDKNDLRVFVKKMIEKIESKQLNFMNFDYSRDNLSGFIEKIEKQKDLFVTKKSFIKSLNCEKMIELINQCNSKEIYEIDGMFYTIYSYSNLNDIFKEDLDTLIEFRNGLQGISDKNEFDNIKKKRIQYFIEHIDEIITSINR